MIFWIGLLIALVVGVLSVSLAREKIARKYPKFKKSHIDIILIVLLVVGLSASAWDHQNTERLTAPPSLSVDHVETNIENGSVSVIIYLRSDKNEPLGILAFLAELPADSDEKIIDFWPYGGAFSTGEDSKQIAPDGKSAILRYALISGINPVIEIELTGKTSIMLTGNFGPKRTQIDVATN